MLFYFSLGLHVAKILTQVHVTKREAQIKLDETDFDERRLINKRKKLINEGKDPDEVEQEIKRKRKEKRRKQFDRKKEIGKNNEEVSAFSQKDEDIKEEKLVTEGKDSEKVDQNIISKVKEKDENYLKEKRK